MAYLAQILPGKTLIDSSYIFQKLRLYVKLKLVVWPMMAQLRHLILHFSHILPCNLEMVSLTNPKVCYKFYMLSLSVKSLKAVGVIVRSP